jgi:hypothetical protein
MLYSYDGIYVVNSRKDEAMQALSDLISCGSKKAESVVRYVIDTPPDDVIVDRSSFDFISKAGCTGIVVKSNELRLHCNAVIQFIERLGFPKRYGMALFDMGEEWSADLLASSLNAFKDNTIGDRRFLLRCVNDEVRAVLSDRYLRIESVEILKAFSKACNKFKAVGVGGYVLDTRFVIKMLLPVVFEPIENELVGFGVILQNSDFGDGTLSVSLYILCMNNPKKMNEIICGDAIRHVHLGGTLPDDLLKADNSLETTLKASAVYDSVHDILSPDNIRKKCELIRRANDTKADFNYMLTKIGRYVRLNKSDKGKASLVFGNPMRIFKDCEEIGCRKGSVWCLSNALAHTGSLAIEKGDDAKALCLHEAAGSVLDGLND